MIDVNERFLVGRERVKQGQRRLVTWNPKSNLRGGAKLRWECVQRIGKGHRIR